MEPNPFNKNSKSRLVSQSFARCSPGGPGEYDATPEPTKTTIGALDCRRNRRGTTPKMNKRYTDPLRQSRRAHPNLEGAPTAGCVELRPQEEQFVRRRSDKMKKTPIAFLICCLACFAGGTKANDTVTITFNRTVIGSTPLTYKVGEYAFNAKKTSLFSKRLSAPVVIRVSKDGYVAREVAITQEMF